MTYLFESLVVALSRLQRYRLNSNLLRLSRSLPPVAVFHRRMRRRGKGESSEGFKKVRSDHKGWTDCIQVGVPERRHRRTRRCPTRPAHGGLTIQDYRRMTNQLPPGGMRSLRERYWREGADLSSSFEPGTASITLTNCRHI